VPLSKLTAFEKLWRGMERCEVEGLYVRTDGNKQRLPAYLERKGYKVYREESTIAMIKVRERFFGLAVSEIHLPAGTWSTYGLTINAPVEVVRRRLREVYGSDFPPSDDSYYGERPELIAPGRKGDVVLHCSGGEL
jgi:hypothetical protein